MATVMLRNLPEAVHRALRVRAGRHGRSTEAEIQSILETTVHRSNSVRLGALLTSIAREAGGLTDEEAERFDQLRDGVQALPIEFE